MLMIVSPFEKEHLQVDSNKSKFELLINPTTLGIFLNYNSGHLRNITYGEHCQEQVIKRETNLIFWFIFTINCMIQ